MLTLWDLIKPMFPRAVRAGGNRSEAKRRPAGTAGPLKGEAASLSCEPKKLESAAERYERVARELLSVHDIRVRKWRTGMSGVAWRVRYADGRVVRLIEAPRPRGPMSAAVFLHEVGHHVIGLGVHKPRCLEEYMAWRWALEAMEARGLNVTDAVRRRMHRSLWYAAQKARRRGIKELPPELHEYAASPEPRPCHTRVTRKTKSPRRPST